MQGRMSLRRMRVVRMALSIEIDLTPHPSGFCPTDSNNDDDVDVDVSDSIHLWKEDKQESERIKLLR